jgi:hypothetical protein
MLVTGVLPLHLPDLCQGMGRDVSRTGWKMSALQSTQRFPRQSHVGQRAILQSPDHAPYPASQAEATRHGFSEQPGQGRLHRSPLPGDLAAKSKSTTTTSSNPDPTDTSSPPDPITATAFASGDVSTRTGTAGRSNAIQGPHTRRPSDVMAPARPKDPPPGYTTRTGTRPCAALAPAARPASPRNPDRTSRAETSPRRIPLIRTTFPRARISSSVWSRNIGGSTQASGRGATVRRRRSASRGGVARSPWSTRRRTLAPPSPSCASLCRSTRPPSTFAHGSEARTCPSPPRSGPGASTAMT